MKVPPRFGFPEIVLLVLVLATAAGARAWYLHEYADDGRKTAERVQTDRTEELDTLARNLKEHGRFASAAPLSGGVEEDTAHIAPGYPYLRYAVMLATPDADLATRWLQAALGTLTAGLYFLFAHRAFHSRVVATLCGLFCAVHPFWLINTAELNDGVLATFLLAVTLSLGARAGQEGGAFTSLLCGLALAASCLVRAAMLPFAFVALLWFLLRSRSLQRGWIVALLATLGFANGLLPWTVRNYQVFGEVMPVVDTAYYHLWVGNFPNANGGDAGLEFEPGAGGLSRDLASQPQPRRYSQLASLVVDEVRRNPNETGSRRLWATLHFLFGETWLPMGLWLVAERYFFGLVTTAMLFLGLIGWRWTYAWRRESMPAALAFIWVPLPYIVSHGSEMFGERLPLDGVLLCYAAFALIALLPGRIGSQLREGPQANEGGNV